MNAEQRDLIQGDIHDNAVAKGWWPGDRTWHEVRILIVSEIAEALEEFRAGRMTTWCHADHLAIAEEARATGGNAPAKPEGFAVELADAAIRILDYRGRMGWTSSRYHGDPYLEFPGQPIPEQLDGVVDVLYSYDEDSSEHACDEVLSALYALASARDINLDACIELKHAYNKTRPFRHGGKAA